MPPVQISYPGTHVAAYAGLIANQELHNIVSRVVAVAAIAWGVAVARGASDDAVQPVGSAGAGAFFGISCVSPQVPADANNEYPVTSNAAVVTKGVVWVVAAVAVTAGQAVYLDGSGNFTNVASGDTVIQGATFDSSTTAVGQLAKVRLS